MLHKKNYLPIPFVKQIKIGSCVNNKIMIVNYILLTTSMVLGSINQKLLFTWYTPEPRIVGTH